MKGVTAHAQNRLKTVAYQRDPEKFRGHDWQSIIYGTWYHDSIHTRLFSILVNRLLSSTFGHYFRRSERRIHYSRVRPFNIIQPEESFLQTFFPIINSMIIWCVVSSIICFHLTVLCIKTMVSFWQEEVPRPTYVWLGCLVENVFWLSNCKKISC
jgi:hypothetical protein